MSETYGRLPLHFEANRGQTHRDVRFLARGLGYSLYLTAGEAVLVLSKPNPEGQRNARGKPKQLDAPAEAKPAVMRMSLVGAAPAPRVSGLEELPGKANYFIGNDPAKWRTNVPTYAKVHYREVYPGIDLLYYGNQRQLEYDFVVAPGADPQRITLGFQGAERLEIDAEGDLVLYTSAGPIRQRRPVIYQEVEGIRQTIAGGYVLRGTQAVGFQVSAYDPTRPLIIDPVLVYSTYLGGSGDDRGFGIALDVAGNAYVTGRTASTNFPTTPGALDTAHNGDADAFVTKLDAAGSALVYSTYLGGSGVDAGIAIAIDSAGNAYVTGQTHSSNFPTTSGAFDMTFNGGFNAFVTKLDPAGSALIYSTYLGGSQSCLGTGADSGQGIAVDALGNAYVTGFTASFDFPTTPGSFQPTNPDFCGGDAFVTKLNQTGSALVYSTYLAGTHLAGDVGHGIAVGAGGNAYVTGITCSNNFPTTVGSFQSLDPDPGTSPLDGCDAFVTKLNPSLSGPASLVYSTYLGGAGHDQGNGIAVDALGNAYVTGGAASTDFPTTPGALDMTFNGGVTDAFVTKLDPTGSTLVYSTYLGGSGDEGPVPFGGVGAGIAVDAAGNAYVTSQTTSTNFPTTPGAFQTSLGGGIDAFVTKLDPTGSTLVYSTYLGGGSDDGGASIALDALPFPNAYVTGFTRSTNFPTTTGAFDTSFNGDFDAFVVKIAEVRPPATLVLSPVMDTNPVATPHCVTATVQDAFGNPTPGVIVRFMVTGSINTTGSGTTDTNGQVTFCYTGPPLPGADAITAFADTNSNATQDASEPAGAAAKTWVLPVSTPGCEVTIAEGGKITALNGDTATFSGHAQVSASGQEVSGQQHYQDHGPAQPLKVSSINVLAVVCSVDRNEATIFGQATIDGAGSFNYRIHVMDLGEPGKDTDVYGILLSTGYFSGDQTLEAGNVQITVQK